MGLKNSLALKILYVVWGTSLLSYLLMISIDNSVFSNALNNVDLLSSFTYLFFCVLLLGLGIKYGHTDWHKNKHVSYLKSLCKERINNGFSISNLLFIGLPTLSLIIGFLLFQVSGFTGDLESQRQIHVSGTNTKLDGGFYILQQIIQSLTLIIVVFIPWIRNKSNLILICVSLMIFTGFLLTSLSFGGRVTIFAYFILPLSMSFVVKESITGISSRITNILKILLLITSLLLIAFVFVAWQFVRSLGGHQGLAGSILLPYAEFLSSLGLEGELNFILAFALRDILNYLSNGIQLFSYFFEVYEPHPLFGGYQFSIISSRFVEEGRWFEWKGEVEDCYRYFGLYWNVWGSFVRDYIVDFGIVATPIISYITGFFIGYVEKRFLSKRSWFALYVILLSWLVMSPYYSLLLLRSFHISLLIIILWVALGSYSVRKSHKEEFNNEYPEH